MKNLKLFYHVFVLTAGACLLTGTHAKAMTCDDLNKQIQVFAQEADQFEAGIKASKGKIKPKEEELDKRIELLRPLSHTRCTPQGVVAQERRSDAYLVKSHFDGILAQY